MALCLEDRPADRDGVGLRLRFSSSLLGGLWHIEVMTWSTCSTESCTRRTRSDNRTGLCARCASNNRVKEWKAANPERVADYNEKNKDRLRAASRASAKRHAERNPEDTRRRVLSWKAENRDRVNEMERARRKGDLEHCRLLSRASAQRRRARIVGAGGTISAEVVCRVLARYGHTCAACGSSARLEIDHAVALVAGGTNEERNLQVLCRSCNASKGAETRYYSPRTQATEQQPQTPVGTASE